MMRTAAIAASLSLLGFAACPSEDDTAHRASRVSNENSISGAIEASGESSGGATTPVPEIATTDDDLARRYPDGLWLSYSPLSDMKWTLNDASITDPDIAHAQATDLKLFLEQNLFPQISLSIAVLHLDLTQNRAGFVMAFSNTAILVPWTPRGDLRAVALWCDAFLTRDQSAANSIQLMSRTGIDFEALEQAADEIHLDPLVSPRRRAESLDQLRKQLELRPHEFEGLRTTKPAIYQRLKGFERRYDAEVRPVRNSLMLIDPEPAARLPLMHLDLRTKLPQVYDKAWTKRDR